MFLESDDFDHQAPIPAEFALARPDSALHSVLSANRNPGLAWGDVPAGARSLVLLCIDVDVPTVGDDVNQEGRSVSRDLPRTEFVHWMMVDVPPSSRGVAAGECSDGVIPGGKADPPGPAGARQGANDYTGWFAGDPGMAGTWRGYDGPGPPWNDELVHHYHFQLFALDVERLDVPDDFTLAEVRAAMDGHVLAQAELVGTYTQNPALV